LCERFIPGGCFHFSAILNFSDTLLQDCTVFERVRDFVSQAGKIVSFEGALDDVFLFVVIAEEGGTERLILDVVMLRRDEVTSQGTFCLVLTPAGRHQLTN
jgi:hypothetical protein